MRWLSPPLRVAEAAVEGEVAQPDIEQELKAVLEFNEQPVGDGAFIGSEVESAQDHQHFIDGARQQLGQGYGRPPGHKRLRVLVGFRHRCHMRFCPDNG